MKNILRIYIKYFLFNWLEFKRSQYWKSSLFSKAVFTVGFIFGEVIIIVGGLNFKQIASFYFPRSNTFTVFNTYFFPILIIIYFTRLFTKKDISFNIKAYLHLPVSKKKFIALFLLLRIVNIYTISIIAFIISFGLANIFTTHPFYRSLLWFINISLIICMLELIYVFVKINYLKSPYKTALLLLTFTVSIFLLREVIKPFNNVINTWGNIITGNETTLLIFVLLTPAIFYFTNRFIIENIYIDIDLSTKETKFNFLSSLNIEGKYPLIFLQILLITRDRILRRQLITGIFGLLFGVAVNTIIPEQKLNSHLILEIFFILLSSGYLFTAAYSAVIFGWDGYYMSFLFSKKIMLKKYIDSKVLFLRILWLCSGVINLFLIEIIHHDYLLMTLAFSFYASGVLSYTQAIQSILIYKPINANESILQVTSSNLFSKYVQIIFVALPVVIYLTFGRQSLHEYLPYSLEALCVLSIIVLTMQKSLLQYLYKLFNRKRYNFIENYL